MEKGNKEHFTHLDCGKMIKNYVRISDKTDQEIARACGWRDRSTLYSMYSKGNRMTVESFLNVMRALEIEVIIKTRTRPIVVRPDAGLEMEMGNTVVLWEQTEWKRPELNQED